MRYATFCKKEIVTSKARNRTWRFSFPAHYASWCGCYE